MYRLIPASGIGNSGINYDQTDYSYDLMRNRNRVQSPGGTITRTVFTEQNQPAEVWVGTDDTGATDGNPAGSGAPNNMVQVTVNEYDDNKSGGDGNLTLVRQYANASDYRETGYTYDFRNRQISKTGEIGYYEDYAYDNMDRRVQSNFRESDGTGILLACSEIYYDPRGRSYLSLRYEVNGGTTGRSVQNKTWYDPCGNIIKQVQAGSQQFQKTQYDSLNRAVKAFLCFDFSEADDNYGAAGNVVGNTVQQQTETAYDEASNTIQLTTRMRFHNATGTGELTTPDGAQPQARVSFIVTYPDPLGRTEAEANYGTNGAAPFSRPDTIPASADAVLVTLSAYNDAGVLWQTTDSSGIVNQTTFDAAGRKIVTIENYVAGGTSSDQNKTTEMTYTADGLMATLTLLNAVTGDQVTAWIYGITLADSSIARSDFLRAKEYPDMTDAGDRMEYAYNRQGQPTQIQDQRGVIRALEYDKLGRKVQDRAVTIPSGVDAAVRRLAWTYDVRALLATLTSYDDASVGLGNIVNQISYEWNGYGQLTVERQSHDGAVDASTPSVRYEYSAVDANYSQQTRLTYPDGFVLAYNYGDLGGEDDALNRVQQLRAATETVLVDYSYLGQDQVVLANYAEPAVGLTYFTSDGTGEGGDQYTGLDRFGRIVDQRWCQTASGTDVERVKFGYSPASNRLWRQNTVAVTGQDEHYGYDNLSQVKALDRGTLDSDKAGIAGTPVWAEGWNYDPVGNRHGERSAYLTQENGATTLDQNRAHNRANEITDISAAIGPVWPTPVQDAAGNMISIPCPLALDSSFLLVWDAWNRLVSVSNPDGSLVAAYGYDGAKRRVTNASGTDTRHFYYSDQWQVLEERLESLGTTDRRFVWGVISFDDLVLRDRELGDGGKAAGIFSASLSAAQGSERIYALNDSLSVTAVIDTTGSVLERYSYDGFGTPCYLAPILDRARIPVMDGKPFFTLIATIPILGYIKFAIVTNTPHWVVGYPETRSANRAASIFLPLLVIIQSTILIRAD